MKVLYFTSSILGNISDQWFWEFLQPFFNLVFYHTYRIRNFQLLQKMVNNKVLLLRTSLIHKTMVSTNLQIHFCLFRWCNFYRWFLIQSNFIVWAIMVIRIKINFSWKILIYHLKVTILANYCFAPLPNLFNNEVLLSISSNYFKFFLL